MVNLTPLCEIAYKYGTDKCPQIGHSYTPIYFEMFKSKRLSVKKVLEMGIGYPKTMWFLPEYKTGASLRMWRDFFPNAHIYGADISSESLFEDERITTYLCDERKVSDIKSLIKKTGKDLDIFIDDASHTWQDQVFLAKNIIPLLKRDVTYIIEDVGWPQHTISELKDFKCIVHTPPRLSYIGKKNRIIIVKNI